MKTKVYERMTKGRWKGMYMTWDKEPGGGRGRN